MNSRRRNRPRRSRRATAQREIKDLSRRIDLVASNQLIEVRCPIVPPDVSPNTTVTRLCPIYFVKGPDGAGVKNSWHFGNSASPSVCYTEVSNNNYDSSSFPGQLKDASNKKFILGCNLNQCAKILSSKLHRSGVKSNPSGFEPDDSLDLFTHIKVIKLSVWGPIGDENLPGFPIQATLRKIVGEIGSTNYSSFGNKTVTAVGTKTVRAHLAISDPSPKFIPLTLGTTGSHKKDVFTITVGWNVPRGGTTIDKNLIDGDILAVVHLTLSGYCSADTDDSAKETLKDRSDLDSISSSIENLSIRERKPTGKRKTGY